MRISARFYRVSSIITVLMLAVLMLGNLPQALAANLSATNAPIVAGGTVVFSGGGFSPSEMLSVWTTAPNGDVAAKSQISADGQGQASYSLPTFGYAYGIWSLTLHGLSSGAEAIAAFEVISSQPVTPAPSPTPAPNPADAANVPQGGLNVEPKVAYAGQAVTISGSGFAPDELISLWDTSPQGSVYKLNAVRSDDNGNLIYVYGAKGPATGIWAITAHGQVSGVEKTGFLQVISNATVTAQLQLTPDKGDTNTQFTVQGKNFLPEETFSFWLTAPDNQVYPGFQGKTDANGSFSFTYSIPAYKPGSWAITANGRTSSRQVVAYFTLQN